MKKRILLVFLVLYIFYGKNAIKIYAKEELEIVAPSAIVMDVATETVIYDKESHEKMYPASITKLMTVLLALEYAKGDYSQKITFSRNAVYSLPKGASHIAMDMNDELSLEDCFYAILLASANEVANAVAEHISGTTEEFAKRMTQRAKELGAEQTNFKNANGLHDDEHYTTAYDMALIMRELTKYPEFIKIISTKNYKIAPTLRKTEATPLNNSDHMILPGKYYDEDVVGGKTGYTSEALNTLVTYAKRDNMELVAVVLKSDRNQNYVDTKNLLDYGFTKFAYMEIYNKADIHLEIPIKQNVGDKTSSYAQIQGDDVIIKFLPTTFDKKDIEIKYDVPEFLQAPLEAGREVGEATLYYKGILLGSVKLTNTNDVPITQNLENLNTLQNNEVIDTGKWELEMQENDSNGFQSLLNTLQEMTKNFRFRIANNFYEIMIFIFVSLLCITFIIQVLYSGIKKKPLNKKSKSNLKMCTMRRYRYR